LAFPELVALLTYCGKCGTFGNERHFSFLESCSSRFRVVYCAWLLQRQKSRVQWQGAMEKTEVAGLQKLILLVAHVAELADALDSGFQNHRFAALLGTSFITHQILI
jgi:hypothetical protein